MELKDIVKVDSNNNYLINDIENLLDLLIDETRVALSSNGRSKGLHWTFGRLDDYYGLSESHSFLRKNILFSYETGFGKSFSFGIFENKDEFFSSHKIVFLNNRYYEAHYQEEKDTSYFIFTISNHNPKLRVLIDLIWGVINKEHIRDLQYSIKNFMEAECEN